MHKPKVIAFSGGCLSGKTTAMEQVRAILNSKGIRCEILNEVVRNHDIGSIDEIRSNPSEYLKFQENVIKSKVRKESSAKNNMLFVGAEVILVDRALTDSLFYLLFYTDKAKLTHDELLSYEILYSFVDHKAKKHFKEVYDLVFMFSPLRDVKNNDMFRPKNIDIIKHIEHRMIKTLTTHYSSMEDKIVSFDLNNYSERKVNQIADMIWDV